jgi:hypothetical protein
MATISIREQIDMKLKSKYYEKLERIMSIVGKQPEGVTMDEIKRREELFLFLLKKENENDKLINLISENDTEETCEREETCEYEETDICSQAETEICEYEETEICEYEETEICEYEETEICEYEENQEYNRFNF